jgi:hypothetical protein
MSKAEKLRQMAMDENAKQSTAQEFSEAVAETAEAVPRTPDELAQLLEPLMSVMLKLLEDTAHALEELKRSSTWIKGRNTHLFETSEHYLVKLGTKVGEIQDIQRETAKSAQSIHKKAQEVLQHRERRSRLQRWMVPLMAVAISSLLWSGLVLWRMQDIGTLADYQSLTYHTLKEMKEQLPVKLPKGTK